MLPIPTHLIEFFTPSGNNDEFKANGTINCKCGNDMFEVLSSNDRQIVKLICKKCNREILLFDASKHGWNGFVAKAIHLDCTLPFEEYACPKCKNDRVTIQVEFSSQGIDDFIEECVNNDKLFKESDWVNGFDWIKISLFCQKCGYKHKNWVNYKTM